MIARLLFLLTLFPCLLVAQASVDLQQAFLDLKNDGVLMCISAHPDDEDGATLAYYRMKYGVKTYSVFLTRGEGGQNEKGPELYEELGVLRTAETRAAGEIQGTEPYFLNFKDFGYSKSATEALHKWGRQEVLRRLVYVIRKLKPDVIFSNLNTIDGHGHHQAAVVTAIGAFDAAADSTFAPEQLRLSGISVWQPKKLFIRNVNRPDLGFNDWGRVDVVNNIGEVNEARNLAYIDIATKALRMHKTQGLDRVDLRRFARSQSFYKLIRSNSLYDRDTTSFFGGIDFWNDPAVTLLVPLRKSLSSLRLGMPRDSLLRVASSVLEQIASMQNSGRSGSLAERMLGRWRDELERLVRLSCNINIDVRVADSILVPKQQVLCALEVLSPECRVSAVKCDFRVPDGWPVNEAIGQAPGLDEKHYTRDFTMVVGEAPVFTLPKGVAQYRPIETEQRVSAIIRCLVDGHPFDFSEPVKFDIAPPELLSISPRVTWISPSKASRGVTFDYTIRNFRPREFGGRIRMQGPSGWRAESPAYKIEREDGSIRGAITVYPAKELTQGDYKLLFKTDYSGEEATARVFEATVAKGVQVGIVKSQDNTFETALNELGVSYKLLDENDLKGNLSKYNSIIIDIRAYLVREDLRAANAHMLEYMKDGGNLVVMYQRPQEWKPEYAPYPFQISSRRVTVEEAPIDVLQPNHPLLTRPNRISEEDWLGWKQERAVYFPTDVAKEYAQLLSSHDPDEAPLTTGYLLTDYGKGTYIYTSYVWYRQLKEMNPGSFRCFANMISYPLVRK